MPRDNKIWDERSRPALIPKWGMAKCELLDQGENDIERDCATYAVRQCLIAMGIDVDNWPIHLELEKFEGNPTSIGDNLEACVRLRYIKGRISTSYWPSYLKAVSRQPVVLGLHQYEGMTRSIDNWISMSNSKVRNPDCSPAKHAVCATGHVGKRGWWRGGGHYSFLMDTRASVGRCMISDKDLKLLFDRGEAICFVPVV